MPYRTPWEDEWYRDSDTDITYHHSHRRASSRERDRPAARRIDTEDYRRSSHYLDPNHGFGSGLHRSKSTGGQPIPQVNIYTTNDLHQDPSTRLGVGGSRTDVRAESRGRGDSDSDREHRRGRRSARQSVSELVQEELLKEELAELRMQRMSRSRGRSDATFHHPPRSREGSPTYWALKRAEEELKEKERLRDWELQQERMKRDYELKESLLKKELKLKEAEDRLAQDKRSREEKDRIQRLKDEIEREEREKEEEMKKFALEQEARRKAEKEKREKILLEQEAEARKEKDRLDRLILDREARERKEREERKRLIKEHEAKMKAEQEEKEEEEKRAIAAWEKKQADKKAAQAAAEKAAVEKWQREQKEKADKEKKEYEEFLLKQKAKEEKAKAEQKEKEQEMQDEMRKRLSKLGFAENQIEVMIDPKKAQEQKQLLAPGQLPNNPLPYQGPTYVKIHKDHLSVDTLLYYDIPWEYDRVNKDYIIILREMDKHETDILFEHTRRLRQRTTLTIEAGGKRPEKDYAWVRKSTKGRKGTSPSPVRRTKETRVSAWEILR